ncbi:MAG: hypothetical protein MJ188_06660 [Treponema sp.]|nr:hypothetical protein [Treponema sp.]
MNSRKLDKLLIETLQKIAFEIKDSLEYANKYSDSDSDFYADLSESLEEMHFALDEIEKLVAEITSIDDLAEKDEDTITLVYDYLADYAGNFIISPKNTLQYKKDMKTYKNLEELLFLFMDDEE